MTFCCFVIVVYFFVVVWVFFTGIFIFSKKKKRLDISSVSSALQKIHMKCHLIFSKNKILYIFFKMSSAVILFAPLSVNFTNNSISSNFCQISFEHRRIFSFGNVCKELFHSNGWYVL